jgi:hypothetical protein
MFFKRLFGISDSNMGEVLTKVSDRTWVSTSGELINQVSSNMGVSADGTTYVKTGSVVVGSDGSMFSHMGACDRSDDDSF